MISKGKQPWRSVTESPDTDLPVPSLCREPGCCSLAQAKTGMILRVRELSAPAEIAGMAHPQFPAGEVAPAVLGSRGPRWR